jgi:phospholipid transport system substrate-binding protein
MARLSILLTAALLATALPAGAVYAQGTPVAVAIDVPGAANTVSDFGSRTLRMLQDKTLTKAGRERDFRASLEADFDFQIIARFVLGRYWLAATAQERQAFSAVFKDYVVQSYSALFDGFGVQHLKVTGERAEGAATTIVRTDVARSNSAELTKVDWRVLKLGDSYKIVEVIVEGVSVSMVQRQEVASIMDRNGQQISDLIAQIRGKTAISGGP